MAKTDSGLLGGLSESEEEEELETRLLPVDMENDENFYGIEEDEAQQGGNIIDSPSGELLAIPVAAVAEASSIATATVVASTATDSAESNKTTASIASGRRSPGSSNTAAIGRKLNKKLVK